MKTALDMFNQQLEDIASKGLTKSERQIDSRQGPRITLADGRQLINMCANNYLGLSGDPGLVEAAKRSGLTGARPVALGNVRGQLHGMLEERAPLYESLADLVVATDGRLADEVADEIADWEERA